MGEKKMVKVSLGSLIYLFIIVILISIIAGMWVYYNSEKLSNKNNTVQQANTVQSTNKINTIDNNSQQSNTITTSIENNENENTIFFDAPRWYSKKDELNSSVLFGWR